MSGKEEEVAAVVVRSEKPWFNSSIAFFAVRKQGREVYIFGNEKPMKQCPDSRVGARALHHSGNLRELSQKTFSLRQGVGHKVVSRRW